MPLQLVGLEGLDKTQALCAPVRPVQLISLSSRKLWGGPSESGAIRLAGSKHGPDNPCVLVGDSNRGAVEATPLPKLVDPFIVGVGLGRSRSYNSPRAVDEQAAQVLVSALRNAHQDLPVPAGELPRDKANPGSEMASVLELGAVADGGDDRCGGLNTDALDLGDPLAWLTLEEYPFDFLVERGDPTIEIAKQIVEFTNCFARQRRQIVGEVSQDLGYNTPSTGDAFRHC